MVNEAEVLHSCLLKKEHVYTMFRYSWMGYRARRGKEYISHLSHISEPCSSTSDIWTVCREYNVTSYEATEIRLSRSP